VDRRTEEGSDEAALLELITASWTSQAIRAAAELGIAELLAAGPLTSAELAVSAHAHPGFLHQLLRALTTVGIVAETDHGAFELTSMGALLPSLRSWSTWWGRYAWPEWAALVDSVRTGISGRALLAGKPGFAGIEADSEMADVFSSAMAELTDLETHHIVRACDFSRFGHIVDVGGGYGELLVSILAAYPQVRGTVFDRAHCEEGARRHIDEAGVSDRCKVLTGDFFEGLPGGADAYVVKNVIHDWDDAGAQRILENCRRSMEPSSRLILIERVMPDRLTTSAAHQSSARSDLHMLVAHGARERTESELAGLLVDTSFAPRPAVRAGTLGIVEAVPV